MKHPFPVRRFLFSFLLIVSSLILTPDFAIVPVVFPQVRSVGQPTVTDGTKLSEYVELVDGIYLNEIMLEM